MNIHSPERQPNESQVEYRGRQRVSKAIVRRLTLRGLGDQRKAPSSRDQLRDKQNGRLRKLHSYSQGLLNVRTRKQRDAIEAKKSRAA